MKRAVLFVLCAMAVSTSAFAQASGDIDKATLAAPANMREGATVIKWKPDHTYDTLRKGTNRLVCYDRSGFPLQHLHHSGTIDIIHILFYFSKKQTQQKRGNCIFSLPFSLLDKLSRR